MDADVRLFQQNCQERTGAPGNGRSAATGARRKHPPGRIPAESGDCARGNDSDTALGGAPAEAAAEIPPVDGLKISSQSWRRGGLGSKALLTFTLRNDNDYAVTDIEIFCAFARRDGSHLTDRKRTIHDTLNMKSRKTFARLHVGFVNVNANRAKCSLVTANRV